MRPKLNDLPSDVHTQIMLFLTPRDICSNSRICKSIWLISTQDLLWRLYLQNTIDLVNKYAMTVFPLNNPIVIPSGFEIERAWNCAYKQAGIALSYLHPLFGLWRREAMPRGGILYITLDIDSGAVVATEIIGSMTGTQTVRRRMFVCPLNACDPLTLASSNTININSKYSITLTTTSSGIDAFRLINKELDYAALLEANGIPEAVGEAHEERYRVAEEIEWIRNFRLKHATIQWLSGYGNENTEATNRNTAENNEASAANNEAEITLYNLPLGVKNTDEESDSNGFDIDTDAARDLELFEHFPDITAQGALLQYLASIPPYHPKNYTRYSRIFVQRRHTLEGLWLGAYGPHGTEMMLIQQISPTVLAALKVIGDPNVPCGKYSFAFLIEPLTTLSVKAWRCRSSASDDQLPYPEFTDAANSRELFRNTVGFLHESLGADHRDSASAPSSDQRYPDKVAFYRGKVPLLSHSYTSTLCASQGQVARHGHVGANYLPGILAVYTDSDIEFTWANRSSIRFKRFVVS